MQQVHATEPMNAMGLWVLLPLGLWVVLWLCAVNWQKLWLVLPHGALVASRPPIAHWRRRLVALVVGPLRLAIGHCGGAWRFLPCFAAGFKAGFQDAGRGPRRSSGRLRPKTRACALSMHIPEPLTHSQRIDR